MLSALYDKALKIEDIRESDTISLIRESLILREAERRRSQSSTFMHMMQTLSPDLDSDSRKTLMQMASDQFYKDQVPWLKLGSGAPSSSAKKTLDLSDPDSVQAFYEAALARTKSVRDSHNE